MKIEIELEIQEAVVLLNILKQAVSKEVNPEVQKTLREIITEIEGDAPVSHYILALIKDNFYKNDLTTREIHPESDMYNGLQISKRFLNESNGLTKMAHTILLSVTKKYKPKADISKVKEIGKTAIQKCVTVYDLMVLIENSYDAV